MLEKLKSVITQNIHIVDVLFSGLWAFGWFHNAEQIAKFDLSQLTAFYGVVRAFILGGRVNDSINNSQKEKMP